MVSEEMNDPESSYRRGYQQGAYHALEAAQAAGFTSPRSLREWVDIKVHKWRYGPTRAKRNVPPPKAPGSN
jgi:hypothetical protein